MTRKPEKKIVAGLTLKDLECLANAWTINAKHFANARRCEEGLCVSPDHVGQHSGSCACRPCKVGRTFLLWLAEKHQTATGDPSGNGIAVTGQVDPL